MAPVGGYDPRAPFLEGFVHPFDRARARQVSLHAFARVLDGKPVRRELFGSTALAGDNKAKEEKSTRKQVGVRRCWREKKGVIVEELC